MTDNSDYYFNNKRVVNFEIILHQCRRDPFKKPETQNSLC